MAAQPEIHNFTIVTDRYDVPKTKWDYNAGRIYTTLSDSEQHHLLNIQIITGNCDNFAIFGILSFLLTHPKQPYTPSHIHRSTMGGKLEVDTNDVVSCL